MAYTTVNDPSAYFQTTLYTGNGSTQSITNGGNSDLKPFALNKAFFDIKCFPQLIQ